METPEIPGRSKTNFYTVTRPFSHWTLNRLTPVNLVHRDWAYEGPLTWVQRTDTFGSQRIAQLQGSR